MKNPTIRFARDSDITSILELQLQNHIQNVSEDDKSKYGFVTFLTPLSLLKLLISVECIALLEHERNIIGYIIMIVPEFARKTVFLKPLVDELSKIKNGNKFKEWPGTNHIILGQIFVSHEYGSKGHGQALFEFMKNFFKENQRSQLRFPYITTEVSTANPRSILFHEKLGFVTEKQYTCAGQTFNIISLKTS
jgi:ribosomal protein S18 acetylase RimI-like enzyme